MIVHMQRIRCTGPRERLSDVLAFFQDLALVHVVAPRLSDVPIAAPPPPTREARHCRRLLEDVETSCTLLGLSGARSGPASPPDSPARAARFARGVRRQASRLAESLEALRDEKVMLLRYREFFSVFESLVGHELTWPDGQAFYVVMRAGALTAVGQLRRTLAAAVGQELELFDHPLASGELAVLILASPAASPKVAQLLADSRVQELPAPAGLGQKNLLQALPAIKARLAQLPADMAAAEDERRRLAEATGPRLAALRAWLHDQLLLLEARAKVYVSDSLFVVEGWVPGARREELSRKASEALGPEVLVEWLDTERWGSEDAPVVLRNPPLFAPFEVVTRLLPLPRYGSIDPTPFVAIFFPAFFGLMLGDLGYGAVLALLALLLRRASAPGTPLRSVAQVAGACALFSMGFGLLFGELFGNLGHGLGLHPLWFNREEAIVPFLLLAVGLGVVHVTLGLVLAVVSAWRRGHRRHAAGRGVAALMVLFTVLALVAAFGVLPAQLFLPLALVALVGFPVLLALEGVVAVIEVLSTFGHVLSYARIMALGTASLMLAVVANQLVGALGSVVVGVVFAVFFHLVNFVIGVFSPTIHALRLHYVEFFGEFFSPGGAAYAPLAHWQHHPSP